MLRKNREINGYVLGILRQDPSPEPIDITGEYRDIKYYVEPISEIPQTVKRYTEQLGFKDLYFSGIAKNINGWKDDVSLSDSERKSLFRNFIENKVIIFKPCIVLKDRTFDFNKQDVFFNISRDAWLVDKPKNGGNTFITVPILDDYSSMDFETRISNVQPISLSNILDIHEFEESKPLLYNNGYIYGNFDSYEKKLNACIFSSSKGWKKFKIDLNDNTIKDNSIKVGNRILFIEQTFIEEIITNWLYKPSETIDVKTESDSIINIEVVAPQSNLVTESDFLNRLNLCAKKDGLTYDIKDLINFHIALKTGSLVILSGISGTGKSKLTNLYKKALQIPDEQFKMISVKPNWSDDSDLLGFLDIANNIYRPADTGLVDLLIDAGKPNSDSKIYIICLDEMNLARVEHYFSQFLSRLELTGLEKGINLYNDIEGRKIHNWREYDSDIRIANNVFFIGTINTDETTHSFSDKVLDRANLIQITVGSFKEWKRNLEDDEIEPIDISPIDMELFSKWINFDREPVLTDREIDFFDELNCILLEVDINKAIGYRIVTQIDKYLKNIPTDLDSCFTRNYAFDLQVSQRILPKIRGSLEELKSLVGTNIEQGKIFELLDKYKDICNFVETRRLLEQKARELSIHGYTS